MCVVVVDETSVARRGLPGQVARFAAVGVIAACVDFGTYHLVLDEGVWIHAARALSFVVATTMAYVLNRRWVFHVAGNTRRAVGFALLYVTTFFVILGVHALGLSVLPLAWWTTTVAWALSQGFGSTCNFVMLRTVIFRD